MTVHGHINLKNIFLMDTVRPQGSSTTWWYFLEDFFLNMAVERSPVIPVWEFSRRLPDMNEVKIMSSKFDVISEPYSRHRSLSDVQVISQM